MATQRRSGQINTHKDKDKTVSILPSREEKRKLKNHESQRPSTAQLYHHHTISYIRTCYPKDHLPRSYTITTPYHIYVPAIPAACPRSSPPFTTPSPSPVPRTIPRTVPGTISGSFSGIIAGTVAGGVTGARAGAITAATPTTAPSSVPRVFPACRTPPGGGGTVLFLVLTLVFIHAFGLVGQYRRAAHHLRQPSQARPGQAKPSQAKPSQSGRRTDGGRKPKACGGGVLTLLGVGRISAIHGGNDVPHARPDEAKANQWATTHTRAMGANREGGALSYRT